MNCKQGDEIPCDCCAAANLVAVKKKVATWLVDVEKALETGAPASGCFGCVGLCHEVKKTKWKKYPLGSDEGTLQAVSGWQTLAEDGSNADLQRLDQTDFQDDLYDDKIFAGKENSAKLPCELLKSGSAVCQCGECCNFAIYDDNHFEVTDDSIHSEDVLNELTTTTHI